MADPNNAKDYFEKHGILNLLASGIAQVVNMNPDEPVKFIGKYLLKHQQTQIALKEREAKVKEHAAADAKVLAAANVSDGKAEKLQAIKDEDEKLLENAKQLTTRIQVLDLMGTHIKNRTGATSVYFGVVRANEEPAGDDDTEKLLFESSTEPKQLDQVLVKGEGVVFDVLVEDEPDEEEDPENPSPPKPRKVLHIANLLEPSIRKRVKWYTGRPLPGALASLAINFNTHMHAEALEAPLPDGWPEVKEPEPKAEEENPEENDEPAEEEEVVPDPPTQPARMVMCVESTGQTIDFSSNMEWLKTQCGNLETILNETDKQEFLLHRNANKALLESEDVSTCLGEFEKLSHLLHPNNELRDKYHSIAVAMGAKNEDLENTSKVAVWRKVLNFFKQAMLDPPTQAAKAVSDMKESCTELNEATPSGVSKALVYFSTLVTIAPPEEAPA